MEVKTLQEVIHSLGRPDQQRDTLYRYLSPVASSSAVSR